METKDTSKILEELKLCPDFSRFYDENKSYMVGQSLAELLEDLLKKKNTKKSDVIRRSDLSEIYAYQIFSGMRVPDRKKLLCLAFGMGLDIEETQTLLKCAGYPVVLYGLVKRLPILETNALLYEYGQETLG